MDNRILIVIPYLAREAQGRELEFAIAGWRKHFKTPHHIVIVGDKYPVVKWDNVSWIPCPRIDWDTEDLDNYIPHLDHVRKFRKVCESFPHTDGFVYACDDMYAIKDFDINTILQPKIVAKDMGGDIHHPNGWIRDKAKTRALCMENGLPVWNWVCHLPVYYEWVKLLALYDAYGCDTHSYIVENIYFNTFFSDTEPMMIDGTDKIRCWLTSKEKTQEAINNNFNDCIWCSNSPNGWMPELEKALAEHYGLL